MTRQKAFVALLAVMALWLAFFPWWKSRVTAAPLDEAVTLAPRGSVSREIVVPIPENYELLLVFERAGQPFDKLKALAGEWAHKDGKPVPSGVRVPVRWALETVPGGAVAASGEVDSFGAIAWSAASVDRQIARVRVAPGRYRFTAQILRDVPEFAQVRTRLAMQLPPKASSTWQISLAWWGTLLNTFVVWPAAVLLALAVLWHAGPSARRMEADGQRAR